ncbi:flippase [Methanosphaera sp.]
MSTATKIIKNSSLLIIATIINNLMTFILTLFTARYLGTYNYGVISSATSLVGILTVFTDLGLATYAIREVSRNNSLTSKYFGTVLFFRVIFSLIVFVLYIIFILNSNFDYEATLVMLLFGIYMVISSLTYCFNSLFQSNEQVQYQTIGTIIYSVSVLLIILLIIFYHGNVVSVAAGYPIAMLLSFIYTTYAAIKHYPKFKVSLEKEFIKELFIKGIPFGVSAAFTSIYFWIAQIILTYMSNSTAVGLFSSSQKLLLIVAAILTLFFNVIFPVMSRLFTTDKKQLKQLYHKVMKYALIMGIGMAVLVSFYSADIIYIIYGSEYVVGSKALTILIWAGMFMFLSNISSTMLGAINKQVTVTKITGAGALISIILNMIMIMEYSYIGASISTVIIEFIIVVLMLYALSKTEFSLSLKKSILPILQVIVSNIIMTIVVVICNLPFIIGVLIGLIVYLISLFITRAIDSEDREIIYNFINEIRNKH